MGLFVHKQAPWKEHDFFNQDGECPFSFPLLSFVDYLLELTRNVKISNLQSAIVREIINEGKKLANGGRCPLMYEWHGKKYWGAAHGLAGIMHVLMDMELKPDDKECVKGTLRYMIQNRFPSGNYPSSEGSKEDRLVHWCHGAPGVALTLTKAFQVGIPLAFSACLPFPVTFDSAHMNPLYQLQLKSLKFGTQFD